jgi:hypothetical protein
MFFSKRNSAKKTAAKKHSVPNNSIMVIVIKAPNIAKTPNKKTIKCLSNS